MTAFLFGTLLSLAAGSEESSPAPPPREIEIALREIVVEGIDVDRLRLAYNHVASGLLRRRPELLALLPLAGLSPHYATRAGFTRAVRRSIDHFAGELNDETRRHIEGWFESGRVPLDEAAYLAITAGDVWRDGPTAQRGKSALRSAAPAGPGVRSDGLSCGGDVLAARVSSGGALCAAGVGERAERPRLFRITPALVAGAACVLADYLRSYPTAGASAPAPRAVPFDELVREIQTAVAAADGTSPAAFAGLEHDPGVERGLEELFADLTEIVVGVDLRRSAARVARLEDADGWVIAIGGYMAEVAGVALHRIWTDSIQLAIGRRMRVVWLQSLDELDALFLDPGVKNMVLVGHARLDTFGYEGLTGRPEVTVARLLEWAKLHAAELAPLADRGFLAADHVGLVEYLGQKLDLGWRTRSHDDYARLAQRPGFLKKERMILYACGIGAVAVRPRSADFRTALLAEIRLHPDAGRWLDWIDRGSTIDFHPLWPRAAAAFDAGLPDLLARVRARTARRFDVSEVPDFLDILARHPSRFAGTAWVHDYFEHPAGQGWRVRAVVAEIRRRLEERF